MKSHKKELIASAFGFALSILGIILDRSAIDGTARGWIRVISDGTLVGGTILTVLAILIIGFRGGVFDGLAYGTSRLFKKKDGTEPEYKSYYEYINRHKDNTEKKKMPCMLIPGLGYIAIAVILTVAFYFV